MTVLNFKRPHLPSIELTLAPGLVPPTEALRPPAIDLAGRKKIWFLIGRGKTGKTLLARWLAEVFAESGAQCVFAALDPVNRTLRRYVEGVAEPPSADPAVIRDWLWDLIQYAQTEKLSALVDLGGGDTALSALLQRVPNLAKIMSDNGIEPVAVHLVGPDQQDLSPLAMAEQQGFQPAATVIVLNEAHGRREKFDVILEHPTFQAAMARGASSIWMPALTSDIVRIADANAWQFRSFSRRSAIPFVAATVESWLHRMRDAFDPIATWFPGQ